MRIFHYLICFIYLFTFIPSLSIGKRKLKMPSGPTVTLRRFENQTDSEISLDILHGDEEGIWDIGPNEAYRMDYVRIPLPDTSGAPFDLFRFYYPENPPNDPGSLPNVQLYMSVSRVVNRIDAHRNNILADFRIVALDLATGNRQSGDPLLVDFVIHEHQVDNYLIDLSIRGGIDAEGSTMDVLPNIQPYITAE